MVPLNLFYNAYTCLHALVRMCDCITRQLDLLATWFIFSFNWRIYIYYKEGKYLNIQLIG